MADRDLTASGIETASPNIDAVPAFEALAWPLTATGIETRSPDLDVIPSFHVVGVSEYVPAPLTIGSPIYVEPTFDAGAGIVINDFAVQSPALGAPTISLSLSVDSVSIHPELGAPTAEKLAFSGLTASNVAAGSPDFGAVTIKQHHTLGGVSKTTAAPALGLPSLMMQKVTLTASSLAVQSPVISSPTIKQRHVESSTDLSVSAPSFARPTMIIIGRAAISSDLSVQAPVIGGPSLKIKYHLSSTNVAVGSPQFGIGGYNVSGVNVAAANFETSSPVFSEPSYGIASPVDLAVDHLEFGTPSVTEYGWLHLYASNLSAGSPEIGEASTVKWEPAKFAAQVAGSQILYRAATGMERAAADLDGGRITAVQAELIRDIWDPDTCPDNLLQYLAWAMGVEYWNDGWSEITKRQWIKNQWTFKNNRGKEAALRMAIDYAGRDVSRWGYTVNKIVTRPQKVFSGPSLTKDEREAWLSQLPQVRVWRMQEAGASGPFKAFLGGSRSLHQHDRRFCLGGMSLRRPLERRDGDGKLTVARTLSAPISVPSTALQRLKRKARWVENGVETDVTVADYGSYWQLHKSGIEDSKVFSGRPIYGRYYIPSDAASRLITIQPDTRLPWRSPVTPTLQAVTSQSEEVVVAGKRGYSVFSDVPLGGYFVPSTAPYRIYQRFAVLDPKVREFRRPPVQFMGTGRYNFPQFTADVDVSVGNTLCPWAAGYGYYMRKLKFFIPHDSTPIIQVRKSVQASKALRDRIMLRSGPKPRFVAGGVPILAGIDEVIVGRP